jgi:hypothetical protein
MNLKPGDLCQIIRCPQWMDPFGLSGRHVGKTVVLIAVCGCPDAHWRVSGVKAIIASVCLRKIPPDEMVDGLFHVRQREIA